MPIKWTPENDQILLVEILETHQLSVDTKKVSEAWPQADPNAIPTPRAITERLHRIKKASKENIESLAATPKKAATSKIKTPDTARSRKRNSMALERPVPKRVKNEAELDLHGSPVATSNKKIKEEEHGSTSDIPLDDSPATYQFPQRVRTARRMPLDLVDYHDEDTDRDAKYETDVSEYLADNYIKTEEYA
ncbi:hypothetical protein CIHG_02724 [Coccidioides immitis H538.4]|uniref:Uncharacterized protein n=1 Tax=Coccidioides immitis H538.4 TaxID=396776 RepID=A0A0J8RJV4_COCIT|nr:hypothetical protein CIHG_02724 [Coccidioides immitis H538.4]